MKEKKEAEFIERKCCINCGSENLLELSSGLFSEKPLCDFINADPWGESPIPYIKNEKWIYVECQNCNQCFHQKILSPEWNDIRFSQWMTQEAIEEFERLQKVDEHHFNKVKQYVSHILRLEKITQSLRNNEAVRILDFGCGWGGFLAVCEQFGFSCYGVDRSSGRRKKSHCATIVSEIDELKSFPETAVGFHVITLFEVLEHLDNPLGLLQSLRDLLVPGGVLVLETPDCTGVTAINTQMQYRQIHPLDHINAFTPKTLNSIAERVGFRLIKQPTAHVNCNRFQIIKIEIKQLLGRLRLYKPTTQMYFVKTNDFRNLS